MSSSTHTQRKDGIISITGDLGSGKSHVCRMLTEHLGSKTISTGGIQRQLAAEMNLTTLELNKLSETSPEIDHRIDGEIIKLAGSSKLICDSRLAWHFLPQSFKICLKVSTAVAAERVLKDDKRSGEHYTSLEQAAQALKARRTSELQRFQQIYGVDCDRLENFDLVIDTSVATPEAIFRLILEHLETPLPASVAPGLLWLPPTAVLPTDDLQRVTDDAAEALRQAIARVGYDPQHPISLATDGNRYVLKDGHRRTSAMLKLQRDWIPSRVHSEPTIPLNGDNLHAWREYHGLATS